MAQKASLSGCSNDSVAARNGRVPQGCLPDAAGSRKHRWAVRML